jgi:NADPH:quinone reductase-like Zn-dependent oxidoreductase
MVDHTKKDIVDAVRMIHPGGIDAIIDVVSERDALGRMAGLLKEGGRLASSVYAADVESLAQRNIRATNVGVQPDARRLEELARMVDAGELTVSLERTFPLERAPGALGESRTGHVRGKIVLLID